MQNKKLYTIRIIKYFRVIYKRFSNKLKKFTTPSQINLSDTLKKLYVYLYDF